MGVVDGAVGGLRNRSPSLFSNSNDSPSSHSTYDGSEMSDMNINNLSDSSDSSDLHGSVDKSDISEEFKTFSLFGVRKKAIIGWIGFDWATGFFGLTTTMLFGPFLTQIVYQYSDSNGDVSLLPPLLANAFPKLSNLLSVQYTSVFSIALMFSVLSQLFVLPVIGSLVDQTGHYKKFLIRLGYFGSSLLFSIFFMGHKWRIMAFVFTVINLFVGSAYVISNSLLGILVPPKDIDEVSGIGFGIGSSGILIQMLLTTVLIEILGIWNPVDTEFAERIGISLFGSLWWAGWLIIPYTLLPTVMKNKVNIEKVELLNENIEKNNVSYKEAIKNTYSQLLETAKELYELKNTFWFVVAFTCYQDAITSLVSVLSIWATEDLKLSMTQYSKIGLFSIIASGLGAFSVGYLNAKLKSSVKVLYLMLVLCFISLIAAIIFVKGFFGCFIFVAFQSFIAGCSYAQSRSLFTKLIPADREAEMFSIFELSSSGTAWIGNLLFIFVNQITHSVRIGMLSILLGIGIGVYYLRFVDEHQGKLDVQNLRKPSK